MAGLFVKKGDTVRIRSGKDRGAQGKVLVTSPKTSKVIVEGVNRVTKHTKVQSTTRGAQEGGIVHQEAPIDVSNVQVVCPQCGEPSRIGYRKGEDGRSVRVCRKCNQDI
jgi:large subunit ribosomal protein L24